MTESKPIYDGMKPLYNPYRHAQCLKNGGHEWHVTPFPPDKWCRHCGRSQSFLLPVLLIAFLIPLMALWLKLKRLKERVIG